MFLTHGLVDANSLFKAVYFVGVALLASTLLSEAAGTIERPPVGQKIVGELFLGVDPLEAPSSPELLTRTTEDSITHVNYRDVDMVLEFAPQPVTFYLELGTYEGGSAILAAKRAEFRAQQSSNGVTATTVVAVDTFLGDVRTLWERSIAERAALMRPDGSIRLYDRFRANVQRAGQSHIVLPLPATSVVALKLIDDWAKKGLLPRPQVVYLDSAHEEGEVLLELQLAWVAVAPGGILYGDDWVLGTSATPDDNRGEGVQRDVMRFAEMHRHQLDDSFGPTVQPMRTLGRVRPGLFVSYLSFQWFMRKRYDFADALASKASSTETIDIAQESASGIDCWSDGFNGTDCCNVQLYGPEGNLKCWDIMFTFLLCCRHPGAAR